MELIRDNWTKNDYDDFVEELRSYADEKYRSCLLYTSDAADE